MEQRCCWSYDHQSSSSSSTLPNSSLLLGDTYLLPILRYDLHSNCWVGTVRDASMDPLKSWMTQKLSRIPSECILYNGIHDFLEERAPTRMLDNLGSVISVLKNKNSSMNVYICKIMRHPLVKILLPKLRIKMNSLLNGSKRTAYLLSRLFPLSNSVQVRWMNCALT